MFQSFGLRAKNIVDAYLYTFAFRLFLHQYYAQAFRYYIPVHIAVGYYTIFDTHLNVTDDLTVDFL